MSDTDDKFWAEYDAQASAEDRIGKKTFQVTQAIHDTWSDGRARHKFNGTLVEANGAKCGMTLNDEPTVEDAKAVAGDKRKMKGVMLSKQNHANLRLYGKTVETLDVGDEIRVETSFREDRSGSGKRYVEVVRILAPNAETEQVKKSSGAVPF